jgi:hypothetical protein
VGARYFLPVPTGSGAYPASYTMNTEALPGVKPLGCGLDHPPASSVKVKDGVELYFSAPLGPSWPVVVNFTFTVTFAFY